MQRQSRTKRSAPIVPNNEIALLIIREILSSSFCVSPTPAPAFCLAFSYCRNDSGVDLFPGLAKRLFESQPVNCLETRRVMPLPIYMADRTPTGEESSRSSLPLSSEGSRRGSVRAALTMSDRSILHEPIGGIRDVNGAGSPSYDVWISPAIYSQMLID